MKIKDYKCKCGRNDFFFADKDNQKGIYCSYCGKWLKWADKDERNLTLKQEPRWIPVSEKLPEPNRLVLCHIMTGTTETYFLALWNDILNAWEEGIGGYRLLENDLGYEVIEWMPLPKFYMSEIELQESEG